ncbi:threonine/serine exporter family protein [Nocardioides sp. SYSU D00065]|uniref:threonine/serine ThrE exporter family protein n=1 Tax=Nocardioides sp. SYSU D00065 TaxID=2817378 RepID=UPI0027DC174B|nr:threonine/serine exporter family protein [Nocardioides sp. SYSU D00065]
MEQQHDGRHDDGQHDGQQDGRDAEAQAVAERAREIHLTMDLCLRIGEMLLSSGAGAADVTATMRSVADHLGLRQAEIDVTFTALSMSYQRSTEDVPALMLRHVQQRDIDYQDLTAVDHLVRDILTDRVDLYMARTRMATIVSVGHDIPRWGVTLASAVMSAAIGVSLGGGLVVLAVAAVAAVLIDRVQLALSRRRFPYFYLQVAGGAIATLLAAAVAATPIAVDPSLVVTANIIVLLAGIGLMGAVQDALTGFYLTAGARLIEVMMATAGIIAGVALGISVADAVPGLALGELVPGRLGFSDLPAVILGSAVAAAAFSVSSYAPRRAVLPVAAITAVAALVAQAFALNGFGRVASAGAAAFFIGLVAYAVAGRVRVPPLVVAVSAIVPFLPGLSIYRGLSFLSDGGFFVSQGILALMTAISVAIALASGVILGEYVAQPLKREARRLENRLAGPRLVGPFRALTRAERRALKRMSGG